MADIATAIDITATGPSSRLAALATYARSLHAAIVRSRRAAAHRRLVEGMSPAQQRDLGLASDPRCLITVDARLMTELLSLR